MSTAQILAPEVRLGDAVGEHTFQLVRALRRRFDEVEILCNYPPGPLPADMAHAVRHVGSHHEARADLTIVQYPLWFPLAEQVRNAQGARLFWYHGVTPPALWGAQRDTELLRDSQIRAALAWHTHLAAVTSPFTAQELHASCDFPPERMRIAPLGIDTAAFARPPSAQALAEIRARWELDGHRVLLFVGRIAGNKRIDLLIDAMARLRAGFAGRFTDLKLLIVGDDSGTIAAQELSQALRQQVTQLGLGEYVHLTGRVESIVPYLHAADLFILPSQHEGFGAPLVEAMAAGAPVIASASGAMPWVLKAQDADGATGLLFAPDDVDDLARQIVRLLDDKALAQGMIARGRVRAEEFSLAVFDERVLAVAEEAAMLVEQGTPFDAMLGQTLYPQADVAIHGYRVRSDAPLVGPLIERVRTNLTSHLKEPYIDKIVTRQVRYNQMLAGELDYLHAEMRQLEAQMAALRAAQRAADSSADAS